MKRLKTFFARRGAVPAACYILAVAVWLVLSLAHAGSDALAKAQGRMTEQIIPVLRPLLSQRHPDPAADCGCLNVDILLDILI